MDRPERRKLQYAARSDILPSLRGTEDSGGPANGEGKTLMPALTRQHSSVKGAKARKEIHQMSNSESENSETPATGKILNIE